jgi:peptidoglycan/xylan/chitin deacetylase (PgdA/CDA1 family)
VDAKRKVVALTFDADMTPHMLAQLKSGAVASWYNAPVIRILKNAHVPATLFLTGLWIQTYATTTRELSQDPLFELGNHSYSHGGFTAGCYGLKPVPEQQDVSEVRKTDSLLRRYADTYVKFFRFPGMCHDAEDVATVHSAGYSIIDGNVYGDDGFQKDAKKIVANILGRVRPGSIIVLHMHGGPDAPQTAAALPIVIKSLREKGYTFEKVSKLLEIKSPSQQH